MRNPRMWREVFIRGGVTTIVAAIAVLFLRAEPWIWLLPVGVVALVVLRWLTAPEEDDDTGERDAPPDDRDR